VPSWRTAVIAIECDPDKIRLLVRGVFDGPIREKAVSRFDCPTMPESCYLLAGEATVTLAGGAPATS
jgi:hypothetical protein